MRVIGTAGHVDHGKSTLVEALTGINPDRLKEEREREMTIDLGFAWLTLPNGEEVGIVDVPGHRDFIENMLAGIGGIDAALFVVAADEGVMPQTQEHLAILDLLQIQGGVIALTKIDMVSDPDWLDLIEEDVRKAIKGTVLESVPFVRVSARQNIGLQELKMAITACLAARSPRSDLGRPRLPVDRVFTMPGFGTIVTGTLIDGHFSLGDEVEILPQGTHGRVRGLQSHKRKTEEALPGSRTAVNIAGVDMDKMARGNVVAHPGDYQPSRHLDAQFRLLANVSQPMRHNVQVKIFAGTAEVLARLRLLGQETLLPGQQGWIQLELTEPIIASRGDHYILRRPSPPETIGGGVVVDPHPKERHKRFAQAVLDQLQALAQGSNSDILFHAITSLGVASKHEAIVRAGLNSEAGSDAFKKLFANQQLIALDPLEMPSKPSDDTLVVTRSYWDMEAGNLLQTLQSYHASFPLRTGVPREELKSRQKIPTRLFSALVRSLAAQAKINEHGAYLCLSGHEIHFTVEQQKQVNELLAFFAASPYTPPTIKECQSRVGEHIYNALVELGEFVPVSSEVVFRKQDYVHLQDEIIHFLQEKGTVTVAEVRDIFDTSRRYVLALLEYMDAKGATVRDGDVRRLRLPAKPNSH